MPIALLKFPIDLLRDIFKLCDPFEFANPADTVVHHYYIRVRRY
ncbi:Protein CBG07996 [Caenorhabditis briggsae]|uniref:Protein CBG07996 n=1 Tax=Caenorhabditis briggsae TaxID=6238 RepID=A8X5J3_CAEBR|nr:Protein CBG07996 [Caenorhabditis briggsae]CAP27904.2 Protein CBG07996 [Caenorhabditis briggsae]